MNALTPALHAALSEDTQLAGMLAKYKGLPAVFTSRPVPGAAKEPYIISAGEVNDLPWDTKNSRGREVRRDVAVYAEADGSPLVVEAIAERVRTILHRRALVIQGYNWVISDVTGPIALDGDGSYGRVLTLTLKAQET